MILSPIFVVFMDSVSYMSSSFSPNSPYEPRFLSIEPLLGPIPDLNLDGIDWVIVGGESGPKARPVSEEWVLDIRNQCIDKGVSFFFKQWDGVNKKKNGRLLEGRTWNEYPDKNIRLNSPTISEGICR